MHICRYTYGLYVHPKTFADACDVHIHICICIYSEVRKPFGKLQSKTMGTGLNEMNTLQKV